MARVTIEDCIVHCTNMYELVHLTTKRVRQLYKGSDPLVKSKNRFIVTALREVAAGRVVAQLAGRNSSEADELLAN